MKALPALGKAAEFVRARDLTCRFPGCNAPAEYCDVDHTVAHPAWCDAPVTISIVCAENTTC